MKKYKLENKIIEELSKIPNISRVCEVVNLSRQTFYRWMQYDNNFKIKVNNALLTGAESINDLAEGTVINKIKSGDLKAAKYWLDNHKKEYTDLRLKFKPSSDKEIQRVEWVIVEPIIDHSES